jgi:hypothetical protein
LILSVYQRTDSTGTRTVLSSFFLIDTCSGDQILASAFGTIPDGAFEINKRTARLRTSTPLAATDLTGEIDLVWTLNDLESVSSDATLLVTRGGEFPSQQWAKSMSDQRSATVTGTVVGYQVTGLGQFGWTSLKERIRD